jgi:hypothetical protein
LTRLGPEGIFWVCWVAALAYVATGYALAFRFSWLRRTRRAEDAPFAVDFLFGGFGWTSFSFLIGRRRIALRDPWITRLLIAWRVLLALCLAGFGYLWMTDFGGR